MTAHESSLSMFVRKKKCLPWHSFLIALALATSGRLTAKVFDGGVDPNNLGKGEWIYVLSDYFSGYAPGVTNVPSLMTYCASNLQ